MIVAHVAGFPLEETVLSLAPAGAAVVTGFAVVLAHVRRRVRRLRSRES